MHTNTYMFTVSTVTSFFTGVPAREEEEEEEEDLLISGGGAKSSKFKRIRVETNEPITKRTFVGRLFHLLLDKSTPTSSTILLPPNQK